jgi:hypothetical protein
VVEFDNKWESVGSNELGQSFSRDQRFGLGQVIAAFIELLEENNSLIGTDRVFGKDCGVGGHGKLLVIHGTGDFLVCLGSGSLKILFKKIYEISRTAL